MQLPLARTQMISKLWCKKLQDKNQNQRCWSERSKVMEDPRVSRGNWYLCRTALFSTEVVAMVQRSRNNPTPTTLKKWRRSEPKIMFVLGGDKNKNNPMMMPSLLLIWGLTATIRWPVIINVIMTRCCLDSMLLLLETVGGWCTWHEDKYAARTKKRVSTRTPHAQERG